MAGLICLLCCGLVGLATPARSMELYLAPGGNDANPGAADRPLATLRGARDCVRRLLTADRNRDITVLVRGGVYRLEEPLVFSLEDGAAPGHSVTYAAAPGETPILTSGLPIRNWRRPGDPPPGLPETARGEVWVADVSAVRDAMAAHASASPTRVERPAWPFRTLYDGERRLLRARGEGFSPTQSATGAGGPDRQTVHFAGQVLRNWPDLRHAELAIVPCYYWTMNLLPLAAVDEAAGTATTTVPATYNMGRNGMPDRAAAWVENVIAVLDQPGEWVLDPDRALLYYWLPGDGPGEGIVAPVLTELVRVEGRIDDAGPADAPVRGLVFRGLTFTQGDRLPWHGGTGWGLQHDWEVFDSPTALLRFRGAEDCAVEDCHFAHSSHTAIRCDLHCRDLRIVGNHIERMGGAGIVLAGYGPGTKDVSHGNTVVNNYLHHTGELYLGYPGIFVWQSGGNQIAHNHLHSMPYTGLVVSGRIGWDRSGKAECSRTVRWQELDPILGAERRARTWQEREPYLHGRNNVIARNDIHHVMEALGDGNCIYISGTGGGNRVCENYCHDCSGRYMNAAIRCDDDQHGTTIEGNIVCRTRGYAEGVISKGRNDIVGNLLVDLRPDQHHRGYIVFPYGDPQGSRVERNILYATRTDVKPYFEGAGRRPGDPAPLLRSTLADYNLYFNTADPDWATALLAEQRGYGIEQHSVQADPQFVDAGAADFRLREGSPAPTLGIQTPVSVAAIGLEPPYRTRHYGRLIRTTIAPEGGKFHGPVEITITVDDRGAQVRYTLDGSEPTRESSRCDGPFILRGPGTVRARAFAEGATDLVGASAYFAPPPPPILEDFEDCRVGDTTPGATTVEESAKFTARVTDEQAAGGTHSLKLVDGPGQQYAFNPHVYYRTQFVAGCIVGRFDLMVDAKTSCYYQWRDYGQGFVRGPTVMVQPGGRLVHGDRELLRLPVGQWVHFEVTAPLGEEATGHFDLRVRAPGMAQPVVFANLPCEPGFRKLDWVGFVAPGHEATVLYVDNVELRQP